MGLVIGFLFVTKLLGLHGTHESPGSGRQHTRVKK
jgi:hypothetical protein